jgi:hydroxypyruvate isomerase
MKFSANLGFLWTELSLPDAIRTAKSAGFDAVECHWPYDTDPEQVRAALDEAGLTMLGVNTRRGDVAGGENGLSALPGRCDEARVAIDEAIDYATTIGAGCVHVMAGFSEGTRAHQTFVVNLSYACAQAAKNKITILIEPLNGYDAPGYFLCSSGQAIAIIEEVAAPNLKLMFDCYHIQLIEGDITNRLRKLLPHIGHIQFASVPNRRSPNQGELDYAYVFNQITALGYHAPVGAEYKPEGATEDTLDWLDVFK